MKEDTKTNNGKSNSSRTAIGILAIESAKFSPIIVNDSGDKWEGAPHEAPEGYEWNGEFEPKSGIGKTATFNEIIALACQAVMEIRSFIDYHEKMSGTLRETQEAFSYIEALVLGSSSPKAIQANKTTEAIVHLLGERSKMRDVLTKAATSTPEQALKTVKAWLYPNGTEPTLIPGTENQENSKN